jgi:GNAT superfamily N-acetyltransferase
VVSLKASADGWVFTLPGVAKTAYHKKKGGSETVQPTIRPAKPEDLPGLIKLWKELMVFHQKRDKFFAISSDGPARFEEFALACLENKLAYLKVAEMQAELVGYCLAVISEYPPVFETKKYGQIFDLAVTAGKRQQGIGAAFFQDVKTWFVLQGVHRLEAGVAVSNEISTKFWRKMGLTAYKELLALDF